MVSVRTGGFCRSPQDFNSGPSQGCRSLAAAILKKIGFSLPGSDSIDDLQPIKIEMQRIDKIEEMDATLCMMTNTKTGKSGAARRSDVMDLFRTDVVKETR